MGNTRPAKGINNRQEGVRRLEVNIISTFGALLLFFYVTESRLFKASWRNDT